MTDIDVGERLTPADIEKYSPLFTAEYWLDGSGQIPPAAAKLRTVKPDPEATTYLHELCRQNFGKVHMGPPELLEAGVYEAGNIAAVKAVKVITEKRTDESFPEERDERPFMTMSKSPSGFMIYNFALGQQSIYERRAIWLIAAESRSGPALFTARVNYDFSDNAGPYDNEDNKVKIVNTGKGLAQLVVGRTEIQKPNAFIRNAEAYVLKILNPPKIKPRWTLYG